MHDRRTHELRTVVVLLTRDPQLSRELPLALDRIDDSVETQVVGTVARLYEHTSRLRPDAAVIDAAALDGEPIESVLAHDYLAPIAIIMVDDPDDDRHRNRILELGVADYIPRNEGYIEPLSHTTFVTGRISKLDGDIEQTERHYREILESLSDGIFVTVRGTLHYVNSQFAAFLGRDAADIIDREQLVDVVATRHRENVQACLDAAQVATQGPQSVEIEIGPEGRAPKRLELTCRASQIQDDQCVVGVARDITDAYRLRAELEKTRRRAAQVERMRALGELAAGVVHDFNNSLGAIVGRLTLARGKLSRGEVLTEDLDVVLKACEQAAKTIERVQTVSRPTRADAWEDLDLQSLAKDASELVRTYLPPDVDLRLELGETPIIRGNVGELVDVLHNLLRNAIDAVGAEGVVTLQTFKRGNHAIVAIADNGRGLDDETRSQIFRPFYSTKGSQGVGLGLSVGRWILRCHDADISVESTLGEGTRFELTFRSFVSTHPPSVPAHKETLSILAVDDDRVVAEMLDDLLRSQGHTVRVVNDASAARSVLESASIDLLLTDLDLPDMTGWELARAARRQQPEIVVGLVTGWPLGAPDEELRARGVDFALVKPFSLEGLQAAFTKLNAPPKLGSG